MPMISLNIVVESVVVGKGEEFDGVSKTKDSEAVNGEEGKKKKKKKQKDGMDFSRATEQADKLSALYNESEYVKVRSGSKISFGY